MQIQNEEFNIQIPQIVKEYEAIREHKSSLFGGVGLAEQSKKNERFYLGNQWAGAAVSGDRPLITLNLISRFCEYKKAMLVSRPVTVRFSSPTVKVTQDGMERLGQLRNELQKTTGQLDLRNNQELDYDLANTMLCEAITGFEKSVAERVGFDYIKDDFVEDAITKGTAVFYAYWDPKVKTGLSLDEGKKIPIKGDIALQTLDINAVGFGNPREKDVQKQPYILIEQRLPVSEVKAYAKELHLSAQSIEQIQPDNGFGGGVSGGVSDNGSQSANDACPLCTVITRLWKCYPKAENEEEKSEEETVHAMMVTGTVVLRKPWNTKLSLYPLSIMRWKDMSHEIYGQSEIQNMIPNQIAINRMATSAVWSAMATGMPITLYNLDVFGSNDLTNDPGQIIGINGPVDGAMQYVQPPSFGAQFQGMIDYISQSSMQLSGANDAALGNMRPDNAQALIVAREAAERPMQPMMNKFYRAVEDLMRIWADMIVHYYADGRPLRVEDTNGVWFIPFPAKMAKDLVMYTQVDVGPSTVYGEIESQMTLERFYGAGIINKLQLLSRVSPNVIPDLAGLMRDARQEEAIITQQEAEQMQMSESPVSGLDPEEQRIFQSLPPEQQNEMLAKAQGGI